jgi:hypothetical protein
MTTPLRRAALLVTAVVAAIAVGLGPAGVQPVAAAADPLRIHVDATYQVDPAAAAVHVTMAVKATNQKPDTSQFVYYYRDLAFGIQPEASHVRASDSSGALSATTRTRSGYTEADVRLRANLYHGQTASLMIRYDLVGGAPRSESAIRVNAAFATFGVWAWGDPGQSSVTVTAPSGSLSEVAGSPMEPRTAGGAESLVASPADPNSFFAIVQRDQPDAYDSTSLDLPGNAAVVVLAWPGDTAWRDTVTTTLRQALPKLEQLIGLPWPVSHALDVTERYTPALEGYAGVFYSDRQAIDVGEDLDPVVIVHETSHAWLNSSLFEERWIGEGLAQEYAWQVESSLVADPLPGRPSAAEPGAITLESWGSPQPIRDQQTDDQEHYGYDASWWVIHQLVATVGLDRMRSAFASAAANETAYPGAGTPEQVTSVDTWQRLLDLTEDPSQPDPAAIDQAFRDYVVGPGGASLLATREQARADYRTLLGEGAGWLPPWSVRKPLGAWDFGAAESAIHEAERVLAERDQISSAAAALDLVPPTGLRQAYEDSQSGLADAEQLARSELDTLATLGAAQAGLDAPRDPIVSLGLLGQDPEGSLAAAKRAFSAGDLAAALASATTATAILTGAVGLGQERLILAAGSSILLVVLLVAGVLLARRSRRRPPTQVGDTALAGGPFPGTAVLPIGTGSSEPYATLPADPNQPPEPPADAGTGTLGGGSDGGLAGT